MHLSRGYLTRIPLWKSQGMGMSRYAENCFELFSIYCAYCLVSDTPLDKIPLLVKIGVMPGFDVHYTEKCYEQNLHFHTQ